MAFNVPPLTSSVALAVMSSAGVLVQVPPSIRRVVVAGEFRPLTTVLVELALPFSANVPALLLTILAKVLVPSAIVSTKLLPASVARFVILTVELVAVMVPACV